MLETSKAKEINRCLEEQLQEKPEIAVILGSGLSGFAEKLGSSVDTPYADIPCFPSGMAQGHPGRIVAGRIQDRPVLVFCGRFHLYQGYGIDEVVLPVQVAQDLGARILIVTCSAGGVNKGLEVGDLFLMEDQINLMGVDPVASIPEKERNPRFLSMAGAYDREILDKCAEQAFILGPNYYRGVIAGLKGPSYETPAEIGWLRTIGADAVSMSIIPEVILARYLGMKVAGLALITNRASDLDKKVLTHEKVLDAADKHGRELFNLLEKIIGALPGGKSDE